MSSGGGIGPDSIMSKYVSKNFKENEDVELRLFRIASRHSKSLPQSRIRSGFASKETPMQNLIFMLELYRKGISETFLLFVEHNSKKLSNI